MILWIPVNRILSHPMNSNVMPPAAMKKLQRHLRRTNRYEPLIVRKLDANHNAATDSAPAHAPAAADSAVGTADQIASADAIITPPDSAANIAAVPTAPQLPPGEQPAPDDGSVYQLLNGHHRLQVLREIGHQAVRCDVWDVDDQEALMLLATLNRLQGGDDPMLRGKLLDALAAARSDSNRTLADLVRELPEDRSALEKALSLARQPLPAPLSPDDVSAELRQAVVFFLRSDQLTTLNRALRRTAPPQEQPEATNHGGRRAAALLRLAESYLEFVEGEIPA